MLGNRGYILCSLISAAVLCQCAAATSAAGSALNKRVYIIIGSTGDSRYLTAAGGLSIDMQPQLLKYTSLFHASMACSSPVFVMCWSKASAAQANLAYNATLSNMIVAQRPDAILRAWQVTTAPTSLNVFFMPESMVPRTCDNNTTRADALVVHCQSPKSGAEKEVFLKQLKLWRQVPPYETLITTVSDNDKERPAVHMHGQQ